MWLLIHFRRELLWYYQDGASFIFPDAWEKYVEPIPEVCVKYFISNNIALSSKYLKVSAAMLSQRSWVRFPVGSHDFHTNCVLNHNGYW